MNPRALSAQVLHQVLNQARSLDVVLPQALSAVANKDCSLVKELCYGTLRWHIRLEALRRQLIQKPPRREDPLVQALVRVGLYQLLYTRVPAYAAVTETVQACRQIGRSRASGFVNGLLRAMERGKEDRLVEVDALEENRFSHPQIWLDRIRESWPKDWKKILEANNQHPPLTLRVNQQRMDTNDYCQRLEAKGIEFRCWPFIPDGVILVKAQPVESIPGFSEGLVSVQDGGAQMAARLLDLAVGQRVLDACAAPGGKSCHILEVEPGLAQLVALDVDERRLVRVRENSARLGFAINIQQGDATGLHWWDGQLFDRILVDAPCSALGVIRRHPEIKLLRQAADVLRLSQIQRRILANLWPLLKKGGMLLYSTCSILPEENEQVIQAFLRDTPGAKLLSTKPTWAKGTGLCWQILPGESDMDGFFYARLEKCE